MSPSATLFFQKRVEPEIRTVDENHNGYEVDPVDEQHGSCCEAETHERQRGQHQFPSAPRVDASDGEEAKDEVNSSCELSELTFKDVLLRADIPKPVLKPMALSLSLMELTKKVSAICQRRPDVLTGCSLHT
jgi:hypothetical protein